MHYFPQRGPRKLDISLLLRVCSECLGDLVFCSTEDGDYYRCIQCDARTPIRSGMGRLVDITARVTQPSDVFPTNVRPEALAS